MPAFSSDERQLLHQSLQDFLAKRYPFEHFRKIVADKAGDGFGRAEWAEYAQMGWLGTALPEDAGGAGGGMTELGIVMAACGAHLVLEPFLGTLALGAAALQGSKCSAHRQLLGEVAEGRHILAFCHTEPDGGFARDYARTTARADGGGFVLDGEKAWMLHADAADTLIVSARAGGSDGAIGLYLVPRKAAGVELVSAPSLDGRRGAGVRLRGVKVGADSKIELGGNPQAAVDALIDRGAIAVCAEAIGAMTAVTAQTVEYLKQRQQFGQPLSRFQVLQHRLVDMSVACEEARVLVHAALEAIDSGQPGASRAVARAKVATARAAHFVGGQAVQLHGGMGMTDELAIGHYYKRLMLCETLFGDAEWYLGQLTRPAAA
jgi:alkylation response protein AidB-like acyl-CoA dehydrogenase